jgi:hypothetical protein
MNQEHKRAVIVGMGYPHLKSLEGPYNDVNLIYDILKKRGYSVSILIDSVISKSEDGINSEDIKESIRWMFEAQYCYFHFSGHGDKDKLILSNDTLGIDYLLKNLNEDQQLIASFDCCDSGDFKMRWRYYKDGEEMISNVCNYNTNKRAIFIGSSSGLSRNITFKNKEYGILSFAMYWSLKKMKPEEMLSLSVLYQSIQSVYKDFQIDQNINIYSGKKYNLNEKYIII